MLLIDLANPTRFLSLVARLLPWLAGLAALRRTDPARLGAMGEAAAGYGIRDGAARLADMVTTAAEEGR